MSEQRYGMSRADDYYDAQDEAAQVKVEVDRRRNRYRTVFTGVAGKWVLDDLRASCGHDVTTFAESATKMAYLEGRRSVFLDILAAMGEFETDVGDDDE